MSLNVLIKEIDNLNISADDDTVTETVVRHDDDDDNETISTQEIQAIVKKQTRLIFAIWQRSRW